MANSLKKWLVLAAFTAVGSLLYKNRRQIVARFLQLPPPSHHVHLQTKIQIPMPDGIRLTADLYRPAGEDKAPTVLIRTPYGRKGLNQFIASLFAERGFNVVCQDTRGRFASKGDFEPYVDEAEDGEATLAWIAAQSWSNGRIGMWGQSYVGYVQWAAASTGTPHLHAMLPAITQANLGGPPDQGFMWLDRTLRWILLLDAMVNPSLPAWKKAALSYYAPVQNQRLQNGWNHLPLATADEAVLGRPEPFYRKWAAHYQPDDPYWQAVDLRPSVPNIDVPIHLVAGWYDIFLQGQLADYAALREAGHAPFLTIGPWPHMDLQGMAAAVREGIHWFEEHLKETTSAAQTTINENQRFPSLFSVKLSGSPCSSVFRFLFSDKRVEALRPLPVRLYVMGIDEWRDYESWPPPARPTPFYLQAMGALAETEPPADSPPDYYRYDPANPTPNLGGPLLSTEAGQVDNRPLEARPDVLTYTTEPLTEPLTVIGHVQLRLFVRSSLAFTDFYGRLCDVCEDGRSLNICEGLYRVQPGRGEPQPDGSLAIEVDMWATAYQFQPGHRLRLQVSSGAHPRISRNLGNGDPVMTGTEMQIAHQIIYHDLDHPATLILPLI